MLFVAFRSTIYPPQQLLFPPVTHWGFFDSILFRISFYRIYIAPLGDFTVVATK
jgi:hypothetical protein